MPGKRSYVDCLLNGLPMKPEQMLRQRKDEWYTGLSLLQVPSEAKSAAKRMIHGKVLHEQLANVARFSHPSGKMVAYKALRQGILSYDEHRRCRKVFTQADAAKHSCPPLEEDFPPLGGPTTSAHKLDPSAQVVSKKFLRCCLAEWKAVTDADTAEKEYVKCRLDPHAPPFFPTSSCLPIKSMDFLAKTTWLTQELAVKQNTFIGILLSQLSARVVEVQKTEAPVDLPIGEVSGAPNMRRPPSPRLDVKNSTELNNRTQEDDDKLQASLSRFQEGFHSSRIIDIKKLTEDYLKTENKKRKHDERNNRSLDIKKLTEAYLQTENMEEKHVASSLPSSTEMLEEKPHKNTTEKPAEKLPATEERSEENPADDDAEKPAEKIRKFPLLKDANVAKSKDMKDAKPEPEQPLDAAPPAANSDTDVDKPKLTKIAMSEEVGDDEHKITEKLAEKLVVKPATEKHAEKLDEKLIEKPAEVPKPMGRAITDYAWSDDKKIISIYIELEGLDNISADAITVVSEERQVSLTIAAVGSPPIKRQLLLSGLREEITEAKITLKPAKSIVVLKLVKKEEKAWTRLFATEGMRLAAPAQLLEMRNFPPLKDLNVAKSKDTKDAKPEPVQPLEVVPPTADSDTDPPLKDANVAKSKDMKDAKPEPVQPLGPCDAKSDEPPVKKDTATNPAVSAPTQTDTLNLLKSGTAASRDPADGAPCLQAAASRDPVDGAP